ncbi:MAG: NADH-quinone oxidoreductase subunit L [Ardenticatenaceae bacterium]|nr:NADH-quinone oxidoreductase subunit L [Ardenticatenaceae bacterium]
MNAYGLAPLLLLFPAVGVLFNGLFGRRFVEADAKVGERWSGWFASLMAISSFVVAVLLFFTLQTNEFHPVVVPIMDWISIPAADFYVPWAIRVDTLSVTMMLVVTGVGSLIHIYAIGYMHGDPNFSRFFTYFSLFIFFMLILVSGSTYLVLFVGWEGVGLCSFLLISFWFDRKNAAGKAMNADAGRKAFIVNRVGDFGMVLAMFLMAWTFRSLEFDTVFETAVEMFKTNHIVQFGLFSAPISVVITAITALFLLGATGKSAQIPLYVWLPDAMAGPTPVSALIHAATMVTSGIYLIVRSNVLFEIARESGPVIFGVISTPDLVALIGASTGLLAGLIAFTQFDIKKVLAYSTVSQLGFMIAAAGMGAYVAAMFHLVAHAFFKALLFLGSGSVIHGMEHGHHHLLHDHSHAEDHEAVFDPQDMRTMGGLRHRMPVTFWTYLIGALALSGIPPLAGFWSKDEILAHANEHAQVVYVVLALAAVCTAFYMGRQLHLTFFGAPRHAAAEHAQESSRLMTVPLIALAALAAVGGLLNLPFLTTRMAEANHHHPAGVFVGLESWLEHSIAAFELTEAGTIHLPHTPIVLSPVVAGISTLLALVALGGAFYIYRNKPETAADPDPLQRIKPLWWFRILPLETFYMKFVVPPFKWLADWLAFAVDWNFWHDFVHNNIIRDMFVSFATFLADVFDKFGVDGTVNGIGSLTKGLAGAIRRTQTGFARTYALGVFLGAVALLVYFLWVLY